MKDRSSKRLSTLQAELDKQRAGTPRQQRLRAQILEHLRDYPFNTREPLFCWLRANHAAVTDMRQRWDGMSRGSIARVVALDQGGPDARCGGSLAVGQSTRAWQVAFKQMILF